MFATIKVAILRFGEFRDTSKWQIFKNIKMRHGKKKKKVQRRERENSFLIKFSVIADVSFYLSIFISLSSIPSPREISINKRDLIGTIDNKGHTRLRLSDGRNIRPQFAFNDCV